MTYDHVAWIIVGTLALACAVIVTLACVYMLLDCQHTRTVAINYPALHEEVRCAQDRLNQ